MADEHARGKDKMTHGAMNTATGAAAQSTIAKDGLAAMVASRICHDLVSPMGAISNGLELLELSQQKTGPEMELIMQSVANANTRLRLYRLAFGTVGDGHLIGQGEIASILEALNTQGRLRYAWLSRMDLTRRQAKLLFLLLLCLETAIPWGGEIFVQDGADGLELAARADRISVDDAMWTILRTAETSAAVPASRVQFLLAASELAAQGQHVALETGESSLLLRLLACS